jgi:hypothetical protein
MSPHSPLIDRRLYVFMAAMFVAIALGGVIPDSIRKLAEISAGVRRPFSPFLHVHAVLMGSWLLLLLGQALLMAMGRKSLHRAIGLAALVIGPAVVTVMIVVSIEGWGTLDRVDALLAEGRAIVYFPLSFLWALAVRGKDPDMHKRMMILATLVLIPAAIAWITWLPTTMPRSFDAVHAYMLLCLAPAVIADVIRGRPHRAYVAGLTLLPPWLIAIHYPWNPPK